MVESGAETTKTTVTDNRSRQYRMQYNAKLRASIRAKLSGPTQPHHRSKVVAACLVLLAIVTVAGGVGLNYLNSQIERQTTASASPVSRPSKTAPVISVDIPYSKTIGFVGDSLTYGCCSDATPAPTDEVKLLGSDYTAINRGVNGSTTRDWLDHLLAPAMDEFKERGVEVVQIMLGTNDVLQKIPAAETVDNLKKIAQRLRNGGVKVVIINKVPYSSGRDDIAMRQLNAALNRLPNGDGVYLGDEAAYDFFRQNQGQLSDGTHMTEEGYMSLAKLWVNAFKRILVEPTQTSLELSAGSMPVTGDTKLKLTVLKSSQWFTPSAGTYSGLAIDDKVVDQGLYSISGTTDETVVTLNHEAISKLSIGKHAVELRFADGTSYSADLTVTD